MLTFLNGMLVAGLVVVGVAYAVWARWFGARRLAGSLARRADLTLDEARTVDIGHRLARRVLGAGIASAAGTALAAAILIRSGGFDGEDGFLSLIGGFLLGGVVGSFAVAWYDVLRTSPPQGARIARARRLSPGDYLTPLYRYGSWGFLTVNLVFFGGLLVVGPRIGVDLAPVSVAVGLMILSAVAAGLQELLSRRVVSLPQTAADPLDLAWDDAMRTETLLEFAYLALWTGAVAFLSTLGTISYQDSAGLATVIVVGLGGLVVGMGTMAVLMVVTIDILPIGRHRRRPSAGRTT
jgi:hypothetical protein